MENVKRSIYVADLVLGSIQHHAHFVSEYERVNKLAENAKGDLAYELYMRLDGISMVLEEYT